MSLIKKMSLTICKSCKKSGYAYIQEHKTSEVVLCKHCGERVTARKSESRAQ